VLTVSVATTSVTTVGAAVVGVAASEGGETTPTPCRFTPATVNVYATPFVRPVTDKGDDTDVTTDTVDVVVDVDVASMAVMT
jgi:hypothetical protein